MSALTADMMLEDRGGVPHYRPGQHRAWTMPEPDQDHAVLRFANGMGWAVLMTCVRDGESWKPEGMVCQIRATGVGKGWQAIPEGTVLSEASLEALRAAKPLDSADWVQHV